MQYDQFLADEYQVQETLEQTQYSVLCAGTNKATGRRVLLRLWLTAQVTTAEAQERIQSEFQTLQAIEQPNLLPLVEIQADEHKVILVSTRPEGQSLNERLGQQGGEALSLAEALYVIESVALALQVLHAHGITHGNLTPQAVFLGNSGQVYVGECLLHSVLASIPSYQASLDEQLPRCFYMAPEQFAGIFDASTDQYALGCLAYVLLTGRVPFAGSARATLLQKHQQGKPQQLTLLNPAIPLHVETAILRALASDPAGRYRSIEAFLRALDIAGEKALADQATLGQDFSGSLLTNGMPSGDQVWTWSDDEPVKTVGPALARTSTLTTSSLQPFAPGRLHSTSSSARRERYVLLPMILLVLLLILLTGRWLFLSDTSHPARPVVSKLTPGSSPAVLLTPAEVTSTPAQAGTMIALQVPTPTPSPTATSSVLPPMVSTPTTPTQTSVALTSYFNNSGIGSGPGKANFDGSGYAIRAASCQPVDH